jgi:hypothetical protein
LRAATSALVLIVAFCGAGRETTAQILNQVAATGRPKPIFVSLRHRRPCPSNLFVSGMLVFIKGVM